MNRDLIYLIDAGNSRVKVSALSSPTQTVLIANTIEELAHWLNERPFQEIWYASVRQPSAFAALHQLARKNGTAIHAVETQRQAFDINNAYADVSTMGVDRWLAMVAVAALTPLPYAVLMFGTAITCDVVANNEHLGGWITPGRQLMQDAVTANTARVFDENTYASQLALGQSTPSCVSLGCFAAAKGVVSVAEEIIKQRFQQYAIYISGGDKDVLQSLSGAQIIHSENLVLQGLARYAERHHSPSKTGDP